MLADCGFEIIWAGAQGRYLRLGYLASRLGGLNARIGQAAAGAVTRLNLAEVAVPVNFGDLMTVYARR